MAYTKTNWENLPSTNTPINETNLNNMENGIEPANTIFVTDTTVDLNNFIHDGYFYFSGVNQTISNIPTGVNGWLHVMESNNDGAVKQIWYRHGTANANDYQTFVRTYAGGIWSDWTEIVTTKETVTFKGYLSNNTDLNNVTEPGIYSTGNATLTNVPISNYTWAFLIVLNQNYVIQQYFIKPVGGICYMRENSGSPSSWKDWIKYLTSQNTSGTPTYNTTYFSSVVRNSYVRNGNVVQLTFIGYTSQAIPNGTPILANVPRNAIESLRMCTFTGNEYVKSAFGGNCYMSGNDTIIKTFGEQASKWVHLDVTYITSD